MIRAEKRKSYQHDYDRKKELPTSLWQKERVTNMVRAEKRVTISVIKCPVHSVKNKAERTAFHVTALNRTIIGTNKWKFVVFDKLCDLFGCCIILRKTISRIIAHIFITFMIKQMLKFSRCKYVNITTKILKLKFLSKNYVNWCLPKEIL